MGGGCWAITGNIRENIGMCNLGFLSIQCWGSAMCTTKKKKRESQLSCISQDLAALPHVLHCIPFSWNCIRTRPVPTILHGIAQLLPKNCTRGTLHNHPPSCGLTSVLGDVAHPRQGLVAALLNDLQVTHLLKERRVANELHESIPPVFLHVFFYEGRVGALCDSEAAVCLFV